MRRGAPKRPGPASYEALKWLAKLGVAGVEPMQWALDLSRSTLYSHLARLEAEGLVARVAAYDGGGGVVIVTTRGAHEAEELGAVDVVIPSVREASSARHGRAVSWVAALAEVRAWDWIGPGAIRARPKWRLHREDGVRHSPDLGFLIGESRRAIEVELHRKSPERMRSILRAYRRSLIESSLSSVTYVTTNKDVVALVKREADRVHVGGALRVGGLDVVISQTRSGR